MAKILQFRRPVSKRITSPTNRHTVEVAAVDGSVRIVIHAVDGTTIEIWHDADEALEIGQLIVDTAIDAGAEW